VHPARRRTFEIAVVASRHAAGALFDCLDLWYLFPQTFRPTAPRRSPGAVRLRRALEDLGPTFMKFGQVLSTRPDIVPPHYEAELELLQDAAPVVPTARIRAEIEDELGGSLDRSFARFDDVPLAAASIGQVHAATLPDGREVVVKVRRPDVDDEIEIDLALLQRIARTIANRASLASRYDPVGLGHEFATTLRAELDYKREARNADLIAANFAHEDDVHVPEIIWNLTSERVITEERVRGVKVDDMVALDAAGLDRVDVARRFANAYLSMVFVHRLFHADPHPGNVFVERTGRIGFVDFGMVGSVGERTAHGLGTILLALVASDEQRMAEGLLGLGVASASVDRDSFQRDLAQFLHRYSGQPLEQLRLGHVLADLMSVVRAHRLRLPSDIALLLKTVMMCEGVAAHLDPTFELVPLLVPYATAFVERPDAGVA
jgi:ubiquinone biosynthesis protein